jgi:hypothetical protein
MSGMHLDRHRSVLPLATIGVFVVAVVTALSRPAHATVTLPPSALIVDDAGPGFAKFGPAAYWYQASGTSFNFYGGSTTWTTNVVTDAVNYARWSLPVSATLPMTYDVYAFIPRYHSSTTNARYQVVRGGITDTRAISQNLYYAEWVSLGSHVFEASGPNLVELTDSTGEVLNGRRIAFDAIAFVPQLAVITGTPQSYLPVLLGGTAITPMQPMTTTSRYISTVNPDRHHVMGCASGGAGEEGTIILAFGQPWTQDGQYGTLYYRSNFTFASTTVIAEAAKGFLRGYWECAPATARLNLAIGTNNYAGQGAASQPDTSFGHGQAWGQMVNQLHTWLQDNAPVGVPDRIAVFGGNDIELSWNTAALTRQWVSGYAGATSRPFVNFGTCDGCPTSGNPGQSPNNGWTVEDVWQVTGQPYVVPFPEIYLRSGVNADQWYRMSLYAAQHKGRMLDFGGALTQWQACQDVGGCGGLTDNTVEQGWGQLQAALNADPNTAMVVPSPSDITWYNPPAPVAADAGVAAAIARVPAGDGAIVDGVLPPLGAAQFLAENAWLGGVEGRPVLVYAGLVRDPATGGDDANARGGLVVAPIGPDGEFALAELRLIPAPVAARALRVADANGAVLGLTDGSVALRFDLATRQWR